METSTAVKALSGGTVGAGVLGASGYGIHTLSTKPNEQKTVKEPETIGEKLKENGENLLPTDNDSEDDVWTKLVEENKEEKDERIKGPSLVGDTDADNIEAMKGFCSILLDTNLTDAGIDGIYGNYNKAKRWCTKPKTAATSN